MTTVELKDTKTATDPIHNYSHKNGAVLVIDNGSYQCRVGWATDKEPLMKFKNLIAKPRKERGKKDGDTQVGNDITNIETVRFQLKTQFDRNVVTHFEAQEQIFDHMFTHLGINTEGRVNHPVLMTEAFLNPNYSRHLMSELLFECYGIPSLCYGVDSLFSLRHNHSNCDAALVISFGYHTTHILPIIGGLVDPTRARRVNVGGWEVISFLHRLLQLKYPSHIASITPSRVEELVHEYSQISPDYLEQLENWADSDYYDDNVIKVQLPYTVTAATTTVTAEQQKERRKELARRLTEINARKREEKLAEDEEQLSQLLAVQDLLDEGSEEEFAKALESYELSNLAELQKMISQLQTKIDKTRQKIVAANAAEDPLTEEPKAKTSKPTLQPKSDEDQNAWIEGLRQKRKEILEKRNARRQRRQDMAKRRTAAAQERMRIISQLARKEKREDTFGMRDEDWDVYKVINKEGGDSDSDEEQKLLEIEEVLRQQDPQFEDANASDPTPLNTAENNQLHLGVERIRGPEVLFQPSMIGSDEAGLAETIQYVLKDYPPDIQQKLVDNVFLTGGCATLPGLVPRLFKELQEMRPFESSFNISLAKNPSLDAWLGARNFASSPDIENYFLSRQEYEEKGGEYFKEHQCSNLFFPSPMENIPTLVTEEAEMDNV